MELYYNGLYFLLLILLLILLRRGLKPGTRRQPPGPFNFPIIGSAHRMLSSRPAHITLRDLSAVYGPIMYFRLGEIPTVVISSAEAAREISKAHDLNFASRSVTNSVQIITKGLQDMTFAPYGDFWRQMRRICVLSLLSPKRTRSFKTIRAEELLLLLRSIEASAAGAAGAAPPVNLSEKAAYLTNRITGVGEEMLDVILEEHREKKSASNWSGGGEDGDEDLLDVLLRCQRDETLPIPISDDHVKCVINDIFAGGSETAASVIEWAMSELIRSSAAMRRAQKEGIGVGLFIFAFVLAEVILKATSKSSIHSDDVSDPLAGHTLCRQPTAITFSSNPEVDISLYPIPPARTSYGH
ncbi:Premnaspirodiene oxygenase [Platanthera zijinensis]|uniref:Premnaspirodiene oxygenase n=1 Tax=Platanthera zijinensis TaxID=2320716 RepID=A0AAP0G7T5_9ASPA